MNGPERRFLGMPNANIVMGARIRGQVTPKLLQSAILKARQKHPLLGVRIHLGDDATGWFVQTNVPEVPIETKPRATEKDWTEVAADQLQQPFFIATGPLIRIILLESPEISDLIITAHHSICDGRSLVYLIRDLMTYLGHPAYEPEPKQVIPIASQEYLPPSISVNWLRKIIIKSINQKWLRKAITFNDEDYQNLHNTFWQRHRASVLRWDMAPSQTAMLVACCQQEQVTVNSALYTAFLKAQKQIQGDAHDYFHNILVPVDFRNRLTKPVDEAVGFYVSAVKFKLKAAKERPFWEMARIIDKKTRQQLTDKNIFAAQKLSLLTPSFLDGMVFAKHGYLDDKMAVSYVKRTGLDKLFAGMTISNLGRLSIPVDYGGLHLDALMGPAVYSDIIEKVLEVVTVGGNMNLTLTYGETFIETSTIMQLKDTAMKYLEEAVIKEASK
ncbi:condensation domain-containing protein [Leptolyngbya sp. Heron Island J]|nr:condensation domain-containing protein [Leptolyngbya sp. Heron Island J]